MRSASPRSASPAPRPFSTGSATRSRCERRPAAALLLGALVAAGACGPAKPGGDDTGDDDVDAGDDEPGGVDARRADARERDGDGGNPLGCGQLRAKIRDFTDEHPDFELDFGDAGPDFHEPGLVEVALGSDGTPVYARDGAVWPHTSGAENFADWYHDRDGVNQATEITLTLTADGTGKSVYSSDAFFPVDGLGFGNQGRPHNFHFTTEIHTSFKYVGGETFTFNGDDDLWLFINGKLALDLGGLHQREEKVIALDTLAASLGITTGGTFAMDIFHAERHTDSSNFRIETTIDCFVVD
jgi:fibro-slime domain-containing protein